MEEIERDISPDGNLVLLILRDPTGDLSVGFDKGTWHTHADLLAHWLGVAESTSVQSFIDALKRDNLPIIMSTDRGLTIDPWVSDALEETLHHSGVENCVVRFWSGKSLSSDPKATSAFARTRD